MSELASYAVQFEVLTRWVKDRFMGLTREQVLARPEGKGNPLIWILGHVAMVRGVLVKGFGASDPAPLEPWERELFGMGKELAALERYPESGRLLELLECRGEAIAARLRAVSVEEAARKGPFPVPFGGDTLAAAVHFMSFHEAYHFGQIGYLSCWQGKPRFA